MPDELYALDFYEVSEYESVGATEELFSTGVSGPVSVPNVGHKVNFGFYEDENGERVADPTPEEKYSDLLSSGLEYARTETYVVRDVVWHYHNAYDSSGFDRLEVTINVLLEAE